MTKRGQTSLEYILLIGAAILIAVLVILVVRSQVIGSVQGQVTQNATSIKQIINNLSS